MNNEEIWEELYALRTRDKQLADRLTEVERRRDMLQACLLNVISVLTSCGTTYPGPGQPHQHNICGGDALQRLHEIQKVIKEELT